MSVCAFDSASTYVPAYPAARPVSFGVGVGYDFGCDFVEMNTVAVGWGLAALSRKCWVPRACKVFWSQIYLLPACLRVIVLVKNKQLGLARGRDIFLEDVRTRTRTRSVPFKYRHTDLNILPPPDDPAIPGI